MSTAPPIIWELIKNMDEEEAGLLLQMMSAPKTRAEL